VNAEVGPGVRYRIPVIEAAHIRPVKRIARLGVASKSGDTVNFTILSGDTNLLEIEVVVQYLIGNLRDYLFAAADPVKLMEMVVREGLVDAVGSNFIDLIFTSNRAYPRASRRTAGRLVTALDSLLTTRDAISGEHWLD